jgi:hypothetical protein
LEEYLEFNVDATLVNNDLCVTLIIEGCNNPDYLEYWNYTLSPANYYIIGGPLNDGANVDSTCNIFLEEGCPYEGFVGYNPEANVYNIDNCTVVVVSGCTNPLALNYNSEANIDDGSCIENILGCTDSNYTEFDIEATNDDGSCSIEVILGCMDSTMYNYNSENEWWV